MNRDFITDNMSSIKKLGVGEGLEGGKPQGLQVTKINTGTHG